VTASGAAIIRESFSTRRCGGSSISIGPLAHCNTGKGAIMGYHSDYIKAVERSKGFKSDYPCSALKEVDKLLEDSYNCKKQSEAKALQKKMDGVFKKANGEIAAAIKKFDSSSLIPKDFPPLVKLRALEKSLLGSEKSADKRVDDLLEKLP
jgi:hypothetical protein